MMMSSKKKSLIAIITLISAFLSSTVSALSETHTIKAKSPFSIVQLLDNKGKEISIKLKYKNISGYSSKGLAIIVPSSTKNMEDENDYANRMAEMGFATVIVDGVTPRFKKKFTKSYTSAMIVSDLAETISFSERTYGKPAKIVVLGSSTGSLALMASQMAPVINAKPSLKNINDIFMLNAACPDKIGPAIATSASIYAVNGDKDDSTTVFACENTKKYNDIPNLTLLTYDGAHHFMSKRFSATKRVDGKHIIPTCSINYEDGGYMYVEKRGTTNAVYEKKAGFKKLQQWVFKHCIKSGHLQGYVPSSAKTFWSDVDRLTQ